MLRRPAATALLLLTTLLAAGCGDEERTAEELPVRTVTAPSPRTLPSTTGTLPSTTTTATEPQAPAATPEGTGGAAPTPPASTTPAPSAPPAPATIPRGTGGVTPGGEEEAEGGAGDEDPTASPGGAAGPLSRSRAGRRH